MLLEEYCLGVNNSALSIIRSLEQVKGNKNYICGNELISLCSCKPLWWMPWLFNLFEQMNL